MKRVLSMALIVTLLAAFSIVIPAGAQDDAIECFGSEGSELSVMGPWAGDEETKFKAAIDPVLAACDITLSYEGTREMNTVLPTRVEGNQAPDLVALSNPGQIAVFAENLVPLTDLNVGADNYDESWQALGSVDDVWFGLPVKTDIKSVVWYSPVAFELAGYEVPTTWEDFVALLDTLQATGTPALATGFESGGATGWTATDFVQDIMICQQGADFVNGLVTGETAWTDPGVVEAWQTYVDLVSNYSAGADVAITTNFLDAVYQPFQDPPQAWLVKQSGFAGGAVAAQFPDYVYGEDYAFFPLPGAGGEAVPMQVGADFMVAFNNTPAVQAVIAYLSSPAGANSWAAQTFDLSPNSAVDPEAYTDPILADKAAALAAADGVVFDVGDLLPGGAGQAEFDNVTAAVQGSTPVEDALAAVQAAFDEANAE